MYTYSVLVVALGLLRTTKS